MEFLIDSFDGIGLYPFLRNTIVYNEEQAPTFRARMEAMTEWVYRHNLREFLSKKPYPGILYEEPQGLNNAQRNFMDPNWISASGTSRDTANYKITFGMGVDGDREVRPTIYIVQQIILTAWCATPLRSDGFLDGAMLKNGIYMYTSEADSRQAKFDWLFDARERMGGGIPRNILRTNMDFYRFGFDLQTPSQSGASGLDFFKTLGALFNKEVVSPVWYELRPAFQHTYKLNLNHISPKYPVKQAIFYPGDTLGFAIADDLAEDWGQVIDPELSQEQKRYVWRKIKRWTAKYGQIGNLAYYMDAMAVVAWKSMSGIHDSKFYEDPDLSIRLDRSLL